MSRFSIKNRFGFIFFSLGLILFMVGCGKQPTLTQVPPDPTPSPLTTMTVPPVPTPTPAETNHRQQLRGTIQPLLMAHYMPWYQSAPVSGAWGWHWTMNHFQPDQKNDKGQSDIASHYYPLTGPYDSSDPALLEYQVLLMKLSGIDGVIVDWYGIEDFYDYAVINASTTKLFNYIEKAGLKFAVCYEDQTVRIMVENKHLEVQHAGAHAQKTMRFLEENWFNAPPYLKLGDRPVLFNFGPQYFKSSSDWQSIFSVLEAAPVLVTLDNPLPPSAVTSFPWPPMWASADGILSRQALEDYLGVFYQKAGSWDYLVASAFPGFNDIYKAAGVGPGYGFLDAQDGNTFKFTLEVALEHDPDVIQLVTWNDYGEGTNIEPTVEYGYRYLEIIQDIRRTAIDDTFAFTPEDLKLPLQLYLLRKQYAGDQQVNQRLDEAHEAITAGKITAAAAIMKEYQENP